MKNKLRTLNVVFLTAIMATIMFSCKPEPKDDPPPPPPPPPEEGSIVLTAFSIGDRASGYGSAYNSDTGAWTFSGNTGQTLFNIGEEIDAITYPRLIIEGTATGNDGGGFTLKLIGGETYPYYDLQFENGKVEIDIAEDISEPMDFTGTVDRIAFENVYNGNAAGNGGSDVALIITKVTFVIDPSALEFRPRTTNIPNNEASLGIIGNSAESSEESVATVEITGGNVAITSVAPGSAVITVSGSEDATINITVGENGVILVNSIIGPFPDVLKFKNGTQVTSAGQWAARRAEIKQILEDSAYGKWRDGTGEVVTYEIIGENTPYTLKIDIELDGKTATFNATVNIPTVPAPDANGYPVIMAFGGFNIAQPVGSYTPNYALANGYASIGIPPSVAAENSKTGAFYTLYPWSEEQTGTLLGMAWGASKVLDALEAGAGEELGINPEYTMIQGTSRYGKAALATGAFEERIKVVIPSSSGAGGLAISRYNSAGQTYDLSEYFAYDNRGSWIVDGSNPQSFTSMKGEANGTGWFTSALQPFTLQNLPFDQHFVAALCAAEDRYLFMVNGFEGDKWTNPPGLFMCFEETLPVYELLGIPENLAVSMHPSTHGIDQEDVVKIINYMNRVWYGKTTLDFSGFPAGKYQPSNWDDFLEQLHLTPFSEEVSAANNATYRSAIPKN